MFASSFNRRQFALRLGLWGALPAASRAQSRLGDQVHIAVGGREELPYLPLAVADALGFFHEEGLDVQIQYHPSGMQALRAVGDAQADVCCGAFDYVIRQWALGMPMHSLVLLERAPQLGLAASVRHWPTVGKGDGFKGLRVGVTALGASTQLFASLWLNQVGALPGDVAFVDTGVGLPALMALRQGRVHALSHPEPVLTLLEQHGEVRLLADARTLRGAQAIFGGPMPGVCLCAPQSFAQRRPEQAQALVDALVHALKWLQTASPADLARVAPQPFLLNDRGAYLAAFDKVRDTLSPDGLMPEEGPATALHVVAGLLPEFSPARIDLSKTYNNDWVRKAKRKFRV